MLWLGWLERGGERGERLVAFGGGGLKSGTGSEVGGVSMGGADGMGERCLWRLK